MGIIPDFDFSVKSLCTVVTVSSLGIEGTLQGSHSSALWTDCSGQKRMFIDLFNAAAFGFIDLGFYFNSPDFSLCCFLWFFHLFLVLLHCHPWSV